MLSFTSANVTHLDHLETTSVSTSSDERHNASSTSVNDAALRRKVRMPPRPSSAPTQPTNIRSRSMADRDTIGLRRRRHIRRRISLPGLPDASDFDIHDLPGINLLPGLDPDSDDEDGITDNEGTPAPAPAAAPPPSPPPPPAAPAGTVPATQPAALPSAKPASAASTVPAVPVVQPSSLPSLSTVPAVPDSVNTGFITRTKPTSNISTIPPLPTTSIADESEDDDDLPTATAITNSLPPPPSQTISTIPTSTSPNSQPVISPTNPALSYNKGPPPETKTAIAAAVSIICISLFCGVIYCLLRFCPPVRDRWTAFKLKRRHERQKRMGMNESPLPPPVFVVDSTGMGQPSAWTTGGLGMRNLGIENGVVRPLSEAHLRPPSYRSHWTVSGASWVANGFRIPDRLSQRMRWSDRTSRSRFMGRGERLRSGTESTSSLGGGLIADGMRPPTMTEPPRVSQVSNAGRVSTADSMSGRSNNSETRSQNGSKSTRASTHSQAGFSTNARISDMSSLSAGTMTNAFRPPPLFRAPIGVARGSGNGFMP